MQSVDTDSLQRFTLRCQSTLNLKLVDPFRDRQGVAGAKDDRRDVYVLADDLRTDQHKLEKVALDHPLVIEVREASRADVDPGSPQSSLRGPASSATLGLSRRSSSVNGARCSVGTILTRPRAR